MALEAGPVRPPAPSDRTRVRRRADRGRYDRTAVEAILDEGFVCHLGFSVDGATWVVPTIYGRAGDLVYLHGAPANHALRALGQGTPACMTVTLVDGLVLARSAFHHSVNYRSVMVFGVAATVVDPAERRHALEVIVEHAVPGRGADTRPPTDKELRSTAVVRLPITEASAKMRSGGPVDDPEDLGLAVWAGEIPLRVRAGPPVPDVGLGALDPPTYAVSYARPAPVPAPPPA